MVLLGCNPVIPAAEFQSSGHQRDGNRADEQADHDAPLPLHSEVEQQAKAGQGGQ
jgi:hypothetical protein